MLFNNKSSLSYVTSTRACCNSCIIARCFSIMCHSSCLDFWVSLCADVSMVEWDEYEHDEVDAVLVGIIMDMLVYMYVCIREEKRRKRKKKRKKKKNYFDVT